MDDLVSQIRDRVEEITERQRDREIQQMYMGDAAQLYTPAMAKKVRACMSACLCVCVCVCLCLPVCRCVLMYMCVRSYAHKASISLALSFTSLPPYAHHHYQVYNPRKSGKK